MPAGRPSVYRPEFAEQAEKLCKLGSTDVELADFFNVTITTIKRWRGSIEKFCAATKKGKDAADDRVADSLYHRAMGYSFESEKVFQNAGKIVRAKTREHVPPDTTAAIFWLKNRRSDEWRDRSEITVKHTAADLSDDELARIAAGGSERDPPPPPDSSQLN